MPMIGKFEQMARKYIEGVGGLFNLRPQTADPRYQPPEVEAAIWLLLCLVLPGNRADLDAIVEQANLMRDMQGEEGGEG